MGMRPKKRSRAGGERGRRDAARAGARSPRAHEKAPEQVTANDPQGATERPMKKDDPARDKTRMENGVLQPLDHAD
jgi:hypothetical protein